VDSELAWAAAGGNGRFTGRPVAQLCLWRHHTALLQSNQRRFAGRAARRPERGHRARLVDKALAAERDGLWGRAYFDARGLSKTDTNSYYLGDELDFWAGEKFGRELGFEINVDKTPARSPPIFDEPDRHLLRLGMTELFPGPFACPRLNSMPGAIRISPASFSAATIRSTNEYWVGPLLAKGATCTMGCVYEPYLAGTPNVAVFSRG